MTTHVGFGPVFALECVTAARRWQTYALRAGFVVVLLAVLTLAWWGDAQNRANAHQPAPSYKDYAALGESFFEAVIGTQLALLLLAAPGAAAGAVCLDKARGNLLHLFTTDLSNAEVVLGKLGSRLLPVLGLVICSLPVLFIGTLLGGTDPEALAGAYAVLAATSVLTCALALTLSVWGHKTHEVLMVVYLIEAAGLLAYSVVEVVIHVFLGGTGSAPDWLWKINPFALVSAPYSSPGSVSWVDYVAFVGGALGLTAALTLVAVARVRAVAVRQAGQEGRARKRWRLASPARRDGRTRRALDHDPVLWYELHRRRPSWWARLVGGAYALIALAFVAGVAVEAWLRESSGIELAMMAQAVVVGLGLLMVSVSSVTALTDERVRGGLDVLLATPLATRAVVAAKWRAAFRRVPWVALPTGLIAAVQSWYSKEWPFAFYLVVLVLFGGAAVTSLGLLIATWVSRTGRAVALSVGVYVVVAVGLPMVGALMESSNGNGPKDFAFVIGSPLYGPVFLSLVHESFLAQQLLECREPFAVWSLVWVGVYLVLAVLLYLLTLASFNRCLGRVNERASRERKRPEFGRSPPVAYAPGSPVSQEETCP